MMRALSLCRCLGLAMVLMTLGCLVEKKCYSDADCDSPGVCGGRGACELQCRVDTDCDNTFGVSFVCSNNRCTLPVSCTVCVFPHALASCVHGVCSMGPCDAGFYDYNADADDGCEYECAPIGDEIADHKDNDCDGLIDEDTDLNNDVLNCGSVGNVCKTVPYANAICLSGQCSFQCYPGWHDENGLDDDGCEVGTQPSCPPDMVAVGSAYCIDPYEASRSDATASNQGSDSSIALSRAGVLPWMVNPMTAAHFTEFEAACQAAGKRLCAKDEWLAACTGPAQTTYVYGDVFNRETCNCVDTFCDDYCSEHSIDPCNTLANCGYDYGCYHEVPTGQFAACSNTYNTFDINGNVWEVVPSTSDARGYEIRGGAFNCASASVRVSCAFNASWSDLYAGFRCCKSHE